MGWAQPGSGTSASPVAVPEEEDRHQAVQGDWWGNTVGLVTNAFKDVGDVATGFWKLGDMVKDDVIGVLDFDLDEDKPEGEDDFHTPDMLAALFGTGEYSEGGSVVLNDYQKRYGGGGQDGLGGWGANTMNEIYQSPLSFLTDALTVVTAGGYGAAKGAQIATKAGLAGEAGASNLSRTAKVIQAIEGNARRVYIPGVNRVEVVPAAWNPARRIMYQNRYLGATTDTTEYLAERAARYAELADLGGPKAVQYAEKANRYRMLVEAAVREGADVVMRPGFANMRGRRFVDKAVGLASGKSGAVPSKVADSFERNFGSIKSQVVPDEDLVNHFQGVDTDLTSDGIIAPGTFDPNSGATRGYRRAEIFPEQGPVTRSEPLEWSNRRPDPNQGDTTGYARILQEIQQKTDTEAGLDEVTAPIAAKLDDPESPLHEAYTALVDDNSAKLVSSDGGVSYYKHLDPDTERTTYFGVTDSGRVLGYRTVEQDGSVLTVAANSAPKGTGSRLLDMHWDDAGVNDAESILEMVGAQDFSEAGAALNASAARRRLGVQPRPPEPTFPATGTAFREDLDDAIRLAEEDRRTLAPLLKEEFGKDAKVVAPKPKAERSIRVKAELAGGWRNVDDISRFRLITDDATNPTTLQNIMDRVEKATGGRIRTVENTINSPEPGGERQLRLVVEMPDGHPVEVQVMTQRMAKAADASSWLKPLLSELAVMNQRGTLVGDDLLKYRIGERMLQHLWEGVTDEIRVARGGPAPADLRVRMNDHRVDIFNELTGPALHHGLDIRSAFDNAFMPLRYKNGARFDPDAVGGKGAIVGGPSPLQLDDALAQAGEMAPIYYPLMDAARLPKRGDFLRRGGAASRGIPSDQNLKRNTGRLLSEATFSKDARTVYRIRAAQQARMQEHIDLLYDIVAEYGRPLENVNAMNPDTEELFAPGLVKHLQKTTNAILDELANDPTGRGMKDLLEKISGDNAQMLLDLHNSAGDIETFAVPKYVAARLRRHGAYKPFGESVDVLFQTPTKLWKTLTLAGRPAWVINNMFTNAMLLKLQGGKFSTVLRQLDKRYVSKMREAMGPELTAQVESGGLVGSVRSTSRAYTGDGFVDQAADWMQQNVAQSRAGTALAKGANWIQSVNQAGEDAFRRASAMTAAERATARRNLQTTASSFQRSKRALERMYQAGLDETTARETIDEVNKYLNDYNTMGPLERTVIRPYLMPFYAFYKHAAKTLVTMPFDHPAKTKLLAYIAEADERRLEGADMDLSNLPGWLKNDMLYKGRTESGDYRFVSGGGLNPFNMVLQSPMQTLHPLWKVAYEQTMGRSTFTNREFTDANTVSNFGSDQQFRYDEATGQMQPVETTAPGLIEHLMQQIPQYEMLEDAIAGGRTYDTTTLLDVLMGDEPVINPETGEPFSKTDALEQLARLFGHSSSEYDVGEMQEKMLEAKEQALKQYLERQSETAAVPVGDGGWAK